MSSLYISAAIVPLTAPAEAAAASSIDNSISQKFKCNEKDCQYGPKGDKFFKKELFLRNHIKNVHSEKKFKCSKCELKFGLKFQQKYHEKYCGQQLQCVTCRKSYDRPTSLLMHCKRLNHELPDHNNSINDFGFKTRKAQKSKETKNSNILFIPLISAPTAAIISNCDNNDCDCDSNTPKHRFILPKPVQNSNQDQPSINMFDNKIDSIETNKSLKLPKRSAECQTIRKRKRKIHRQFESNSIQTQTMFSSFDLRSSSQSSVLMNSNKNLIDDKQKQFESCSFDHECNKNVKHRNNNATKTSTFTQTSLFDDEIESVIQHNIDPFLIRSPMIEDSLNDNQQSKKSNKNFKNIETQTKEDDFLQWNLNDHHDQQRQQSSNDISFDDIFEFIDIETQTIWNYDQTTQTEHNDPSENWCDLMLN